MGAVEDLTSTVQGKVEVIWQGSQIPASMKALGANAMFYRDTDAPFSLRNSRTPRLMPCAATRTRLIAITPLRTSLEAYFVKKLQHSQTTAGVTS